VAHRPPFFALLAPWAGNGGDQTLVGAHEHPEDLVEQISFDHPAPRRTITPMR
jgi:hypothetical protein